MWSERNISWTWSIHTWSAVRLKHPRTLIFKSFQGSPPHTASLSPAGPLRQSERPLLRQAPGWWCGPLTVWASAGPVPGGLPAALGAALGGRVLGQQRALPPDARSGQPPPNRRDGRAGRLPGHLGASVRPRRRQGLSLLQGPAAGGPRGRNWWQKQRAAAGGGEGERWRSEVAARGPSARGLLVRGGAVPGPHRLRLNFTSDHKKYTLQRDIGRQLRGEIPTFLEGNSIWTLRWSSDLNVIRTWKSTGLKRVAWKQLSTQFQDYWTCTCQLSNTKELF